MKDWKVYVLIPRTVLFLGPYTQAYIPDENLTETRSIYCLIFVFKHTYTHGILTEPGKITGGKGPK